jgi:hypothetical protein
LGCSVDGSTTDEGRVVEREPWTERGDRDEVVWMSGQERKWAQMEMEREMDLGMGFGLTINRLVQSTIGESLQVVHGNDGVRVSSEIESVRSARGLLSAPTFIPERSHEPFDDEYLVESLVHRLLEWQRC